MTISLGPEGDGARRLAALERRCRWLTCALVVMGWVSYETVYYLRTAPRFEVQKLSVSGVKHVSENEVIAKAGFELGTNVFHVNLDEIRERVEELDWWQSTELQGLKITSTPVRHYSGRGLRDGNATLWSSWSG